MGLLDDLKRQADMVRTHDSLQRSNLQENVRVVDEAMHRTFLYLLELFKQLEVLKPANPLVYNIETVGPLKDMKYAGAFVDPRKKKFADRDVYDYMDFYVKWAAPTSLVVERDMPHTIKKVKDMLWLFNIKFTELETKSAYGSVSKVKFTIPVAVTVNFTLKADIEGRRLLFYGKNALQLGIDDFAVPADELSDEVLEELAKMLIGQRNSYSAAGAILNPAGLTQFGVSLHDAIKTMPFPVIEVHISNRHAREEWRHHSIISSAAKATVEGLGWRSYTAALRALVEILGETRKA